MANKKNKTQSLQMPRWDVVLRELKLGDRMVHRFNRPAPIAETILNTFEEEGWPPRIDDPLPPIDGRREQERLRKEIHALNRRMKNPLLKFSMDGSGEGIRWRPNA